MSARWKMCLWVTAAPLLLSTLPAAAQVPPDLTYHSVAPCTVVSTTTPFAVNETRTYNVVGNGDLSSQGGSATGCGIPGFSSGIPQAQAVAINMVAAFPTSSGLLRIYAADQPTVKSTINYSAGVTIADTAVVALAQIPGIGDIKVDSAAGSTQVIVKVLGYYSKAVQTVHVHPVPGDATASGTALINALAGITTASATKRFVVKIEPGIYDVGTAGLTMKPFVDIEGSGEEATVIQGPGAATSTTAVLYGAASAELRNLQVKSTASSTDSVAVPIYVLSTNTLISHVTVTASGPSTSTLWGIRLAGSSTPVINDTTIKLTGGNDSQGIVSRGFATPKIHRTDITVTGYTGTGYGILVTSAGEAPEMDGLHVEVSGGATGYGFFQHASSTAAAEITGSKFFVTGTSGLATGVYDSGFDLRISRSTVRASGGTSYGLLGQSSTVDNSEITGATATVIGNAVTIGGSKLDGGAVSGSFMTCAGVWDESYAYFTGPTCP